MIEGLGVNYVSSPEEDVGLIPTNLKQIICAR